MTGKITEEILEDDAKDAWLVAAAAHKAFRAAQSALDNALYDANAADRALQAIKEA